MEEAMTKEIQRLKKELYRKKEEIRDLKKLVNKEIDREFQSDLEELSERELETYIGECFSSMKANIDTKPDEKPITSHRKILGKPIILIKQILSRITGVNSYADLILDKQTSILDNQTEFNRQSIALHQALLISFRKNRERIRQIEEKISDCEENLIIIMNKIKDLHLSQEQLKNKAANHDPTVKD